MKLKWIGFGFIVQGLIEFLITNYSCKSLCFNCSFEQLKPCFFLLIFVGIIFIVIGISIMSLNTQKLPEVKLVKKKR